MKRIAPLILLAAFTTGCAHSPAYDPRDPLEPMNRKVFAFNQTVDRYALRPVAKAYADVTPQPMRTGIGNFFNNLTYPITIVNGLLQLKFKQAAKDTGRFIINTTVGLVGFIDVATPVGLPRHNEDFGQTLGHYGVGQGWFLMLPFLGPSTNRDFVGFLGDTYTLDVRTEMKPVEGYSLAALQVVHFRSTLLSADGFLEEQMDPYVALRTVYLERRLQLVYDGNPPIDYGEAPWDDDDDDWDWDDDDDVSAEVRAVANETED
jgi:phospholipid-binding lipoprotein MlaA